MGKGATGRVCEKDRRFLRVNAGAKLGGGRDAIEIYMKRLSYIRKENVSKIPNDRNTSNAK